MNIHCLLKQFYKQNDDVMRDCAVFISIHTGFHLAIDVPAQFPDLNPVNHKIWGVLQRHVYCTMIRDVDHLKIWWKSGVTSDKTLSTEQFNSVVFDCMLVSVKMAAILSTNCNSSFSSC